MSEISKQSVDIWAEIADQAREAERRAVERQLEFLKWQQQTNARLAAEQLVWGLRQRIQDVAYAIWENAGKEQGKALDDWLQAQEVVLAPVFERTREVAALLWKAAGEPLGRSLEFWLEAEKQVLDSLRDASAGEHAEQEVTRSATNNRARGASSGRHSAESGTED